MELRKSENIGKLVEALSKAQLNFKPIKKENANPFYKSKYADLSTLIDATRPALAAEGLSVIQTLRVVSGRAVEISTLLAHSSGEFLGHDLLLPAVQAVKDRESGEYTERFDAQTIGSASTYGRRYSYQSLLCIAAEEDDDGNAVSGQAKPAREISRRQEPTKEFNPPPEGLITPYQAKQFWDLAKKHGRTQKEIMEFFGRSLGIEGTAEMKQKDYQGACDWIITGEAA